MTQPNTRVAKTKEQYFNEWNAHLKQFSSVFYEAGIPVSDWDAMYLPFQTAIREAADKIFEEKS